MYISITPALNAASECAISAEAAVCRVSEKVMYSTMWYCEYILTPYIYIHVYVHICRAALDAASACAISAEAAVCRVSERAMCSTMWYCVEALLESQLYRHLLWCIG